MGELKPCWKCGSPGKVEENGGYIFAVCKSARCSNSGSWGVDIDVWNRGGITEVQELRARVAKLARFITMNCEGFTGDHACKECHPYSELATAGFQCGLHLAESMMQSDEESEKARRAPN